MFNKKTSRIVVLLIALGLIAPMSAWAGYRGHHAYYGYRSYGHHGYGHRGYGHHGYYRHHGYGHHRYYSQYPPGSYGPDGNVYHGVGAVQNVGALDLNVKPKNTQVYLNGNYIGVTGNLDGFPNFLWLKEGTYELTFYNEGYMTVVQEFAIHRGAVLDVKLRLVSGQSVPPEDLTSKASVGDESR